MIIYCIEDINDLKYVGKTIQKLKHRLYGHRGDKKNDKRCSSAKLNLYNCIIYKLEECEEEVSKEREKYWINKIDCVNEMKYNGEDKEKRKEYLKNYYIENREKIRKKNNRKPLTKEQKVRKIITQRERRKLKKETLKLKTNNK